MKAVRCLVSGRVQGVWFRGTTQKQAQQLGVTGHARNLEDGRVEVIACGDAAAVDQLVAWLHRGPTLARVDAVDVAAAEITDPPPSFSVR
jgi:acylphosphatase